MKIHLFPHSLPVLGTLSFLFLFNTVPMAYAEPMGKETVITATRTPTFLDDQLSDITLISQKEITRSGFTTLTEVLNSVAGVQTTPDTVRGANASIFMRGTNSTHALILVDGQRISSATTGATAIQHIPLSQIERIEILRGPASSLYGADALGGVIQVFTKTGEGNPGVTSTASMGSFGTSTASAGYGKKIDATTYYFQIGAENTRGFNDIKAAKGGLFDAYNADRDGYRQSNLGLQVAHQFSPALELSANYLQSASGKRSDNSNCDASWSVCTSDFDNHDRQRLETIGLRAAYQVNSNWKMQTRWGESKDDLQSWLYDPGTALASVPRYTTRQRQFSWQNDVKWGPGLWMTAIEWRGVQVNSSQSLDVNNQFTQSAVTGYQAWIDRHLFQASMRHDAISRLGSNNTGSVSYGYRMTPHWVAKVATGTGFHAPSFNDLYWPLDYANFFQGNPQLRPEKSRNREIGLVFDREGAHASATVYRNLVKDLIAYTTDDVSGLGTMSNVGAATLKGVSLQARYQWRNWKFASSYDVQSALDDSTGNTLARRVPRTISLDLTRQFDALSLSSRVQANSHKFNDANNSQKLAGYAVIGFRAAYQLDREWAFTSSIQNALNRDYVVIRGSFAPYSDYATAGRSLTLGLRYAAK